MACAAEAHFESQSRLVGGHKVWQLPVDKIGSISPCNQEGLDGADGDEGQTLEKGRL